MKYKTLTGEITARLLLVSMFSVSLTSSSPEVQLDQVTIDTSSFIYKTFDAAFPRGFRGIRWGDWSPDDKLHLAKWREGFEKYNPSHITPQKTSRIPKIIHQIWLGSQLPEKFKKWQASWKAHHPDWEYKLWTDADVDSFNIQNKDAFDNARNFGQKTSIWRYEILNRYGGLYVDVDFECVKSFDVLHHCYDFYTGIENGLYCILGNAVIAAVPGHPILQHCMNNIRIRWMKGNEGFATIRETGPVYFTLRVYDMYSPSDERAIIFPPSYFYPLSFFDRNKSEAQKNKHIKPESFAVHHWASSWVK